MSLPSSYMMYSLSLFLCDYLSVLLMMATRVRMMLDYGYCWLISMRTCWCSYFSFIASDSYMRSLRFSFVRYETSKVLDGLSDIF